jgi:phosphatidylglycerophosphatase A
MHFGCSSFGVGCTIPIQLQCIAAAAARHLAKADQRVFLVTFVGSFLYSGFFPIAPATFASFVFLVIYQFVPGGEWLCHPVVALATLFISVPISTKMETRYGHDAGKIVIDEVVGLQVALVFANPTLAGVIATFFLFRVFDIVKPFPAGRSQKLPSGWGVVTDDVIAGIYTRAALVLLALVMPRVGNFF